MIPLAIASLARRVSWAREAGHGGGRPAVSDVRRHTVGIGRKTPFDVTATGLTVLFTDFNKHEYPIASAGRKEERWRAGRSFERGCWTVMRVRDRVQVGRVNIGSACQIRVGQFRTYVRIESRVVSLAAVGRAAPRRRPPRSGRPSGTNSWLAGAGKRRTHRRRRASPCRRPRAR